MYLTVLAASLFAIVGGPSVGKTSIINALREEGHLTCKETATDVILEEQAKGHATPWNDAGFEIKIFDEKVRREEAAKKLAADQGKSLIFADRGILDQLVYIEILGKQETSEAKYINEKLSELNPSARYKAIFVVEPWSSDNFELTKTEFRREDSKEAILITKKINEVYSKTGLPVITVPPNMTPKERASFILKKVQEFEATSSNSK